MPTGLGNIFIRPRTDSSDKICLTPTDLTVASPSGFVYTRGDRRSVRLSGGRGKLDKVPSSRIELNEAITDSNT